MTVASTQHASVRSSRNPISGNPSFVYSLENFSLNVDREFHQILMMVALSARTSIRLAAKHDPQWSQHADLIDVQVTEDQFQYTLKGPKDRVQAAYDLEYGTPGNPPNSLLRKTALREQQLLPLLLSKRMNAQVPHG